MKITQAKTMTTTTTATMAFALVIGAQGLVGCVADLGGSELGVEAGEEGKDEGAVVIGSVDWQEASSLAEGTAQRQNARAVAYLDIPATGSRCTGFLIAPNVIMTNQHCIPEAGAARGVRAYFRYEQGAAGDTPVDCSGFIGNDAALDYALLQCTTSPGDTLGVVELDARNARSGEGVYALHQNCDYYADPNCAPTKKLSPGTVRQVGNEIGHDADTLGGSSGSPVFAANSHKVIGLHHVGSGGNAMGRGTMNYAVPMTRIVPTLQQRYPGLQLGARAPTTTTTTPPTSDLYEPNDTRAGATAVQVPFASQNARIDANDNDLFTFNSDGRARNIRVTFTHAQGDLDVYVTDAAGAELARSIGTTDVEAIAQAFPAGPVVVRVVGYKGATGAFTLSVQ
ncbi:MAG: serine protease [Deltaproteobacteria bacterium]|nr:serine protease [Deltaproteobacteria bacterium]